MGQTLLRLPVEFANFVGDCLARRSEIRQDRFARQRPVGAAPCDLDTIGRRLGDVREEREHFRAGLETMFGRELAAIRRADECPLGDADESIMGLVVGGCREKWLVGGDKR